MNSTLEWLVILWFIVGAVTVWLRWRWGRPGVGLVAAYLIYLAWIHWVPTLLYLLPWYWTLYSTEIVTLGFVQSLIGILGFSLGALFLSAWRKGSNRANTADEQAPPALSNRHWPAVFLWLGLLGYFVLMPLTMHLPTIGVIASVLSSMLYAGTLSLWWQSDGAHRRRTKFLILLMVALWPIVTVSGQGFLGAGLTLPTLLFLFVARTARRPAVMVLAGVIMVYMAVSVAVNYSTNRDAIRSVVWNEQASEQEQINASLLIFDGFQWFNPRNVEHLGRVEIHTNQNHLVGLAVDRIRRGANEFTYGSTLGDVAIMLIPRALWPDKPVHVGGSAYVSKFTGIAFYGDTSVGMGQIMEFYVNFGAAGVLIGMFLFGLVMTALDEAAARALKQSNWLRFALWYVPAMSLLQTGNNLFILVAGFVSSWLVIYVFMRLWYSRAQSSVAQIDPLVRTPRHHQRSRGGGLSPLNRD